MNNSPRFVFIFEVTRCTPKRRLQRRGWHGVILAGPRPTKDMQRRAARIIARTPHPRPLVSLCPVHAATKAKPYTEEPLNQRPLLTTPTFRKRAA